MTSPTSQAAKLYVVLNQAPNGPHSPADVLRLLQQGTVTRETLICEDGGAAWLPLGQMEAGLRQVVQPSPVEIPPPAPLPPPVAFAPEPAAAAPMMPPPVPEEIPPPAGVPAPAQPSRLPPPVGYGGAAPLAFRKADYPPEPVVVIVERDATKPLRLVTLLAALGMFFLPWVDFRCMNTKVLEQTGLETITGRVNMSEELITMMHGIAMTAAGKGTPQSHLPPPGLPSSADFEEQVGKELDSAWMAAAAMFFVVIGLTTAFGKTGRQNAGVCALLAAMCLGGQCLSGFPLKAKLAAKLKEDARSVPDAPEKEQLMRAMGMPNAAEAMKADYTPWFYAELGLLGLTVFMGFSGGSRRKP